MTVLCKHQLEPETCAMCLREKARPPHVPAPKLVPGDKNQASRRRGQRRATRSRRHYR